LILGMGLPTTANYIVVSTLMAPVIVTLGAQSGLIIPLIAVHLFVFYFGILADDTPPVGLAAFAAAASPDAMASSTLRTKVLIRLRRAVLTAVRRAIWRTRFLADGELAMVIPLSVPRTSAAYTPAIAHCQRIRAMESSVA